jgi:hypothetical protein
LTKTAGVDAFFGVLAFFAAKALLFNIKTKATLSMENRYLFFMDDALIPNYQKVKNLVSLSLAGLLYYE